MRYDPLLLICDGLFPFNLFSSLSPTNDAPYEYDADR